MHYSCMIHNCSHDGRKIEMLRRAKEKICLFGSNIVKIDTYTLSALIEAKIYMSL